MKDSQISGLKITDLLTDYEPGKDQVGKEVRVFLRKIAQEQCFVVQGSINIPVSDRPMYSFAGLAIVGSDSTIKSVENVTELFREGKNDGVITSNLGRILYIQL